MKPHDESVALDRLRPEPSSITEQTGSAHIVGAPRRNPFTAAFMGLAIAVFLWTGGTASGGRLCPSDTHPGASSRTTISKVWDNENLVREVFEA